MQFKTETRVGIFVLAALAVFVYMGFQIGAFRFDRAQYNEYSLYFEDISGLSRKADIKIAGVKVGWIESIDLISDRGMQAKVSAMVHQDYTLYGDSYAMVRQEGLLGPKYVEIIPGSPLLEKIRSGGALGKPSREPVSVDELMRQFRDIAHNVEDVTKSFKDVVGGVHGEKTVREIIENLNVTLKNFSNVSQALDRSIGRNEEHLDDLLEIGTNFRKITDQLEQDVFPAFQTNIEKISNVFDRDFDRIASQLSDTAESLDEASQQAREGLRSISSVSEKIDEGKGLLGKLVNEDETYNDLRVAVQGFRNYVTKMDRLQIVFDTHFESMHRPAENYEFEDGKGYFDVRIHPNQDHFYLIQFVASEKGFIKRKEVERLYTNDKLEPINLDRVLDPETVNSADLLDARFRKQKLYFKRNTVKLGLQFGKIFRDIALRVGLFEGSAGVGVDVDIPFGTDKFRWVTSFEAFDLSGWNRKDDRRPHLKWLNKMFFMRNLYFTFGADDFVSKNNANIFLGAGFRFGDDDVKYMLGSISGAGSIVPQ